MPQVIVGLFSTYRDAHEALRALQLVGLGRDDGQLYRTEQRDADVRFVEGEAPLEVEPRASDSAEYVAHGEHQGWSARATVFVVWASTRPCALTSASTEWSMQLSPRERR